MVWFLAVLGAFLFVLVLATKFRTSLLPKSERDDAHALFLIQLISIDKLDWQSSNRGYDLDYRGELSIKQGYGTVSLLVSHKVIQQLQEAIASQKERQRRVKADAKLEELMQRATTVNVPEPVYAPALEVRGPYPINRGPYVDTRTEEECALDEAGLARTNYWTW